MSKMYVYAFISTLNTVCIFIRILKIRVLVTSRAPCGCRKHMGPIGRIFISPLAPISEIIFVLDCIANTE